MPLGMRSVREYKDKSALFMLIESVLYHPSYTAFRPE